MPKELKPVFASPPVPGMPYQGSSMLPGIARAPITANRAGGASEANISAQRSAGPLRSSASRSRMVRDDPPHHLGGDVRAADRALGELLDPGVRQQRRHQLVEVLLGREPGARDLSPPQHHQPVAEGPGVLAR